MPYCSNCGSLIGEGNRFCNNCGTPIVGQAMPLLPTLDQQAIMRKESINELDRMIMFFGRKQKKYDEYDACSEMLAFLANPQARVKVNIIWGRPYKIWGIIIMLCSLPAALFFGFYFEEGSFTAFLTVLLIILVFGLLLLIVGIIKNRLYEKEQKFQKETLLRQNQDRIADLATELKTHYNAYGYCTVGSAYTNPKILSAIKNMICSGRADTIKEAINVMINNEQYSEAALLAILTAKSNACEVCAEKEAAFFSPKDFAHSIRI